MLAGKAGAYPRVERLNITSPGLSCFFASHKVVDKTAVHSFYYQNILVSTSGSCTVAEHLPRHPEGKDSSLAGRERKNGKNILKVYATYFLNQALSNRE